MNPSATATVPVPQQPLHYLPIGLFGGVMGLSGLSLAWHLAHAHAGAPEWISQAVGAIAVLAFVALLIAYGTKAILSPAATRAEFRHPIAGNLFGTLIISCLLVPMILAPVSLLLARALWVVGAVAMVVYAWTMVDRWMTETQKPEHATPAWIVPMVGMLDVPLAMPMLDLPLEIQFLRLLALAVGLFFAVPLFTLILGRLMFQPQMPPALQPTLLILLAPFSVGVSTYAVAVGRIDQFAFALYLLALFVLAVLVGRLRFLLRCCPFRVGWWAVSFPLASISIAAFRVADAFPGVASNGVAWALLLGSSGVMAWMLVRTLSGVFRGELKALTA
jgi:tellurite resistance protein